MKTVLILPQRMSCRVVVVLNTIVQGKSWASKWPISIRPTSCPYPLNAFLKRNNQKLLSPGGFLLDRVVFSAVKT